MLQSIFFIIITVWLSLGVIVYFYQPKLVFHPHNQIEETPAILSLDYEDLTLSTADGEKINAWWIPHPAARATLLFFHGNAGNISHRLDSINIFHQLGLNVLIIDYRGYGKSTGSPSEQGTYIDATTAWQYLITEKKIPADKIIIFGRSLGGAIASKLAMEQSSAGFIIESSFTSISAMGKHYYPYLPTSLLTRIKYPTIDRIAKINKPTLIIHSQSDEIIPYSHGTQLFEQAQQETSTQKTFLEISGGHNEGFRISGKQYIDGLDRFITDIVQ